MVTLPDFPMHSKKRAACETELFFQHFTLLSSLYTLTDSEYTFLSLVSNALWTLPSFFSYRLESSRDFPIFFKLGYSRAAPDILYMNETFANKCMGIVACHGIPPNKCNIAKQN